MKKKTFDYKGTFQAFYAAEAWCRNNGFSIGSMCGKLPIGIMRGDVLIAKWRNLTEQEIATLDGKMTGSWRTGPVTVEIY